MIIGSNFTVSDPRSDIKCVAYRSVLPFTVPDAKTMTFVHGKTDLYATHFISDLGSETVKFEPIIKIVGT